MPLVGPIASMGKKGKGKKSEKRTKPARDQGVSRSVEKEAAT